MEHCVNQTMSDEQDAAMPAHKKYKDSHVRYQATLYRSTYAIRKEYEQGLNAIVALSGAGSVSNMLSMLAREPVTFSDILRPVFEEMQSEEPRQRRRLKPGMLGLQPDERDEETIEDELLGIAPLEKIHRK